MFAASQKSHCLSRPQQLRGQPRLAQTRRTRCSGYTHPQPSLIFSRVHTFLSSQVFFSIRSPRWIQLPRTHTTHPHVFTRGYPCPFCFSHTREQGHTNSSHPQSPLHTPSCIHAPPHTSLLAPSTLIYTYPPASLQAHLLTRPQTDTSLPK